MTRRRTAKNKPEPIGFVELESRTLMTIQDGDSLKGVRDGALVRYRAEPGLTSQEVERRRQQILDAGAAAVRVEQSGEEGAARAVALPTQPAMEARASMDWRAEMDRLIGAAQGGDREQLRAAVYEALDAIQ